MQKRVLSLAFAIVLIICAFATLSACGRKLKDREITPTIEDIWQDHKASMTKGIFKTPFLFQTKR